MNRVALALVGSAGLLVAGCDNINRSLVFFTNTTAGVDVGIDPTTSSGKVIIGYKRAEGVINPVYQPPAKETIRNSGSGDRGGVSPLVADDGTPLVGDGNARLYWHDGRIVTLTGDRYIGLYSGKLAYSSRQVVDSAGADVSVANGLVSPAAGVSDFLYAKPASAGSPRDYVADATSLGGVARVAGEYASSRTKTEWRPVKEVYRREAYSVLAKIAGEAGGRGTAGQGAEVDAAGKIAQWFATGKAADALANNQFAAAALTGSNKVADAISSDKRLGQRLQGDWDIESIAVLNTVVDGLKEAADKRDQDAKATIDALNSASRKLASSIGSIKAYKVDNKRIVTEEVDLDATDGFDAVEMALSSLKKSTRLLERDILAKVLVGDVVGIGNEDFKTSNGTANPAAEQTLRDAQKLAREEIIRVLGLVKGSSDFLGAMEAAFREWSGLYFVEESK